MAVPQPKDRAPLNLATVAGELATAEGASVGGRVIARVVIEFRDGGEYRWSAPVDRDPNLIPQKELTSTASSIRDQLAKWKQGEWVKGSVLAMSVSEDLDHRGGTFKRAIDELRGWFLESGPGGYRMLAEGSHSDLDSS